MAEENESVGKMTVVHKAKVRCSYSQSSTRLQVTNNENGNGAAGEHIIATEKDCKAGVNLIPYQRCYSPYLVSTMALLYGDLSNEYMNCKSKYVERGYADCIHLLEEVWFEASEKTVVNKMYDMEERLIGVREGDLGDVVRIRPYIKKLKWEIRPLLKEGRGTGYYYDSVLASRERQRNERLTERIEAINGSLDRIEESDLSFGYGEDEALTSDEFMTKYQSLRKLVYEAYRQIEMLKEGKTWDVGPIDRSVKPNDPSDALYMNDGNPKWNGNMVLGEISGHESSHMPVMIIEAPENPERTGDMIAADVSRLECYKTVRQIIFNLKNDLAQIVDKIKDWTTDYTRKLDMNSFMVCRCGGLLTFESNGQEYNEYFSALYLRTMELVTAIKDHYASLEKTEPVWGQPEEKYEMKYVYGYIVDGMDKTSKFLIGESIDDGTMKCNVHFEFVAKSVREQEKMFLSALFTVAGLMPGTATVCGYITALMKIFDKGKKVIGYFSDKEKKMDLTDIWNEAKDTTKDMISIVSGGTPLIKKGAKAFGKEIPEAIEDGLSINGNLSNVLDAFALLTVMNYDLTDNWVESIRVYIFTEEYMFFVEQFLDETCNKKGEPTMYMALGKGDYINSRRGSNIEWGEDPGITYDAKTIFSEKPTRQTPDDRGALFDGVLESDTYGK